MALNYVYENSFIDNLIIGIDSRDQLDQNVKMIKSWNKNKNQESFDMGIMIGSENEGKGYGLEAWSSLMSYLLTEKVSKVTAGTVKENLGMMKIMKMSGMIIDHERMKEIDDNKSNLVYAYKLKEE